MSDTDQPNEESDYGFNWKTDFSPIMALTEANYKTGKFEWVQIKQGVAWYFLEVLPPKAFDGESFAVGEAYTHTEDNHAVYLCIRGIARDQDSPMPAYACYMTVPQFRLERAKPIPQPENHHAPTTTN